MKKNEKSTLPLISYSVLTTFHDQKKDLLEAFLPFVEYGIFNIGKEYIDIKGLRAFIERHYFINFPINTLTTLLKKLAKYGIIKQFENYNKIQVLDASKNITEYKNLFEVCGRDNRMFVSEYKKFSHLESSNDDEIFERLNEFITYSIDQVNLLSEYDKSVITDMRFVSISDFILHIKAYSNSLFDIFKKLYYGYLLSKITDINQISSAKDKGSQMSVIFDSNFIFRLLELQNPFFNEASLELYFILKKEGYELCTFKEIIEEVRSVLENLQIALMNSYIPEKMNEDDANRLDGVQGGYYRKIKTITNLQKLIQNLDESIKSLSITILSADSLKNITAEGDFYDSLYNSRLKKSKNNKPNYMTDEEFLYTGSEKKEEHFLKNLKKKVELDSKIVKFINNKRDGKVYNFSISKYILLSCDKSIFRTNYNFHQNSIPEVISEELLTNTLWIRNPNKIGDASIDLSLSAFQSSKYISYESMVSVYSTIENYISTNPIEASFIGDIFSNQYMIYKINKIEQQEDDNQKNKSLLILVQDLVDQNKRKLQADANTLIKEKQRSKQLEKELQVSIKSNSEINKKRERDKKEISKYKNLYRHYSNNSNNDFTEKQKYIYIIHSLIIIFTNLITIYATKDYCIRFFGGFINLNYNEIQENSMLAIPELFYLTFSIISIVDLKLAIAEYLYRSQMSIVFVKYYIKKAGVILFYLVVTVLVSILIGIFINLYTSKSSG
ncbi:hypothetical protein JWG45_17230 [Leptospira sp. 201903070]|uniref:Uncharacterized protein n=1 Tax=Leptospira ainlahdjerensis TaxID=2810033 RepID=A0ABS2UES8_9LEPT|nr:hypothetical protein [Leptospira ainlahdjerensis]MBM9578891.1 hypothetical protein [Leptospira ainlahdjerensis]